MASGPSGEIPLVENSNHAAMKELSEQIEVLKKKVADLCGEETGLHSEEPPNKKAKAWPFNNKDDDHDKRRYVSVVVPKNTKTVSYQMDVVFGREAGNYDLEEELKKVKKQLADLCGEKTGDGRPTNKVEASPFNNNNNNNNENDDQRYVTVAVPKDTKIVSQQIDVTFCDAS